MDCWTFCTSWILKKVNQNYENSDFIFSEVFPWGSLLPKIWIVLLESFENVEIVHEHKEIFVNLQEDELPLMEEYETWLKEFEKKWWTYLNEDITISYLEDKLDDYLCMIPIKKWEWSHLVVLDSIDNDTVTLFDNKKWEYEVTVEEFEDLMNLYNWKYVLFCK